MSRLRSLRHTMATLTVLTPLQVHRVDVAVTLTSHLHKLLPGFRAAVVENVQIDCCRLQSSTGPEIFLLNFNLPLK